MANTTVSTLCLVAEAFLPGADTVRSVLTLDPFLVYRTAVLMEALCAREHGVGLAAVQVGLPWRFFVARDLVGNQAGYDYCADCEYSAVGDATFRSMEGCLSLRHPDGTSRVFEVERWRTVRLVGFRLLANPQPAFEPFEMQLSGMASVVAQHETDHQRGILISHIGKELVLL